MTLTHQELSVLFHAFNFKEDGSKIVFSKDQLKDVSKITEQLKLLIKDDRIIEGEHEVDLNLDQKKIIKDCVEGRKWSAGDSTTVVSLLDKLEA